MDQERLWQPEEVFFFVGFFFSCSSGALQSMTIKHYWLFVSDRDDRYPVSWLDIRQDSEFATGYGYPKTAFKREPDTDKDVRNAFLDILRIQGLGKSCTLHNNLGEMWDL